jgi:methionyl-tRNA synthetase
LGAFPETAAPLLLRLRGRHSRYADHAQADREGITPEQLIAQVARTSADFTEFGVAFDNYHSTHSKKKFSSLIYERLRDADTSVHAHYPSLRSGQKHVFLTALSRSPKCGAPITATAAAWGNLQTSPN